MVCVKIQLNLWSSWQLVGLISRTHSGRRFESFPRHSIQKASPKFWDAFCHLIGKMNQIVPEDAPMVCVKIQLNLWSSWQLVGLISRTHSGRRFESFPRHSIQKASPKFWDAFCHLIGKMNQIVPEDAPMVCVKIQLNLWSSWQLVGLISRTHSGRRFESFPRHSIQKASPKFWDAFCHLIGKMNQIIPEDAPMVCVKIQLNLWSSWQLVGLVSRTHSGRRFESFPRHSIQKASPKFWDAFCHLIGKMNQIIPEDAPMVCVKIQLNLWSSWQLVGLISRTHSGRRFESFPRHSIQKASPKFWDAFCHLIGKMNQIVPEDAPMVCVKIQLNLWSSWQLVGLISRTHSGRRFESFPRHSIQKASPKFWDAFCHLIGKMNQIVPEDAPMVCVKIQLNLWSSWQLVGLISRTHSGRRFESFPRHSIQKASPKFWDAFCHLIGKMNQIIPEDAPMVCVKIQLNLWSSWQLVGLVSRTHSGRRFESFPRHSIQKASPKFWDAFCIYVRYNIGITKYFLTQSILIIEMRY